MKTYKKFWFLFLIFVININAQISGGGGEKPDGYDYLIITPDVFMQNATWDDELIALQTSRGFRPIIEEISVYTNTQGIKNLIEDYYNNNPLKYVLLMGNAKNLTPRDEPDTSLPYHYIEHGEIVGEVGYINGNYIPFCKILSSNPWNPNGELYIATDDPYVSALTSKGPVYIGRVPVTSVEEANDYVGKLSVYYQSLSTYSEAMNREILLNLDISWYRAGQQRPVTTGELVQEINAELINNHIPSTTTIYEF
ncbi:MAG: C25 family cysteine peptidase, partial [Ignavibacteriaceae bacterium]|nr:C25 family cysteine peptidase [Ignavibacteriaceae bacterium]